MVSSQTLKIVGFRDERVPNTFLRQDSEAEHVALLLPGLRYTCDMPLLHYSVRLLLHLGADALRVEYAYDRRADYQALADADQERWFFTDVCAACHAALAQRSYRRITLIGKSMGTLAMGHLLTTEPALARAEAIWLTPLLTQDALRKQMRQHRGRALFAIGTADPFYDADALAELRAATGGDVVVVEDADHSLEIKDDVIRSVQALEQVMRAVVEILAKVVEPSQG